MLPPGTSLRHGTLLRASDGTLIEVRAALEEVSTVRSQDGLLLTRVAYHLGNRHVTLQLAPGFLRYPRDPVIDDLVRRLGATPETSLAPFEPEAGAYDREQAAP